MNSGYATFTFCSGIQCYFQVEGSGQFYLQLMVSSIDCCFKGFEVGIYMSWYTACSVIWYMPQQRLFPQITCDSWAYPILLYTIFFLKSTIYYMGLSGRPWYLQRRYFNSKGGRKGKRKKLGDTILHQIKQNSDTIIR